jgi:muramidase (phage lysozyme)
MGASKPRIVHQSDSGTHHILVTVRLHPLLQSDAAGRYQLMYRWYHPYALMLGLKDFSPASQDAIATQQIRERHALPMIEAGNVSGAIMACSNIWASFPTSAGTGDYSGQSAHSMSALLAKYQGVLSDFHVARG